VILLAGPDNKGRINIDALFVPQPLITTTTNTNNTNNKMRTIYASIGGVTSQMKSMGARFAAAQAGKPHGAVDGTLKSGVSAVIAKEKTSLNRVHDSPYQSKISLSSSVRSGALSFDN
jgi:hypothetical protein